MPQSTRSTKRVEYAVIMILLGLLLCAIGQPQISGAPSAFLMAIGLAFLVSGLVSVYQEVMNLKIGTPDESQLIEIISRLNQPDIRKIHDERGKYTRYHEWSGVEEKADIFFAGHSVLHRIKADFEGLPIKTVEKAIVEKMQDGSSIRILFMDPSWAYTSEVVESQKQDAGDFYRDLGTTLEVVKRIADTVTKINPQRGSIDIRMCRKNLQYSYHYVKYDETQTVDMLVGLYFAGRKGVESPLFRVESKDIQEYFEAHFAEVFRGATKVFVHNLHERCFYDAVHAKCADCVHQKISTGVAVV